MSHFDYSAALAYALASASCCYARSAFKVASSKLVESPKPPETYYKKKLKIHEIDIMFHLPVGFIPHHRQLRFCIFLDPLN